MANVMVLKPQQDSNKDSQPHVSELEFRHPPLNLDERTIRIIEVLPRFSSDIVQCRMRVVRLEQEHIALSYV